MRHDLLVHEFLELIGQRAERDFKHKNHLAFLAWYVDAEFGRHVAWDFTDDPGDGGVDAIVWRPDDFPPVAIIQSKFNERIGSKLLGQNAYKDFRAVVEAFHQQGEKFDKFIGTTREELRQRYRRALDKLSDIKSWAQEKRAFRLITTAKRRRSAEFDLIPRDAFVYADDILRMYRRYRRGQTPTAPPLPLSIADKMTYRDPHRGICSYLFNARLSDFLEHLKGCDVARLVAKNIRFNLGGHIARDIRHTYEKRPKDFWYFHNGLTIVCDKFFEEGGIATLTNPSVVNGAQTLYAISGSKRVKSGAMVAVRVIVRGKGDVEGIEDDEWLQAVIRGVNTQNRVQPFDFSSNEPEQVELQELFRETKIFYERKRGEWKEFRSDPRFKRFDRVSLRDLALILTACSEDDGQGVLLLKRGIQNVFEGRHYRSLFPSRSKVARRFKRIYLAYRIYRALGEYGYVDTKTRRKQRHAFWNTLWLIHMGITRRKETLTRCSLSGIRKLFDSFEETSLKAKYARRIFRQTTTVVWRTWRRCRRSDPERWSANNFFKAKFGNAQLLRYAMPKIRTELSWLAKQLSV